MFLCQLKTIHLPNGLVSLYLKDNIVELVRKDHLEDVWFSIDIKT